MQTFIKEYDYYILKALANKTKHVYKFFKVGEADNKSRPDTLCKKYTKISPAQMLAQGINV